MIPLEKPGSPEELVHFGVKGMKWGVRNNLRNTRNLNRVLVKETPKAVGTSVKTSVGGMSKKKKVAIGVGVGTAALGAAFIIYKFRRNRIPMKKANTTPLIQDAIDKVLVENGKRSVGKVYKNLDAVPRKAVSGAAQARRTADRQRFIDLMMSSKKYKPSLEEATRIANETYGRL